MQGYSRLAKVQALYPNFALFRKFDALHAQNLLYMQAEITDMELQLREIALDDIEAEKAGETGRANLSTSWRQLKESRDRKGDCLQYNQVMKIRTALKEYSKALLRFAALQQLPHAGTSEHSQLVQWISRPEGGDMFLRPTEDEPWLDENFDDLIATANISKFDVFTTFWRNSVVAWYHNIWAHRAKEQTQTHSKELGISYYSNAKIDVMSRVLGTALAAVFPTVSIFILYFVQSLLARLGIIAAFIVSFSIALAVFTRASGAEVFAATSAFAAVLVVFVTQL